MMGSMSGRAETLTAVHSTLRESFLASDLAESHRSLAEITLAAVLDNERKSTSNSTIVRTLFDIIQTEETPSNHSTSNHLAGKKTWKSLKERLKLRRSNNNNNQNPQSDTGASASLQPPMARLGSIRRVNSFGSESGPGNEIGMLGNGDQIRRSSSMRLYDALAAEREMIRLSNVEPAQEEPSRMSLMDLLEDPTEQLAGIEGMENQSYDNEDEGREEERKCDMVAMVNEEEEKGDGGLIAEMACCVCMVKPKGAAFIPCGHTFCRMCSRELWVKRGHCPLCNNSILEILDIF